MKTMTPTQLDALRKIAAGGGPSSGIRYSTVCVLSRAGLVAVTSSVERHQTRHGLRPTARPRYYVDWLATITEAGKAAL